MKKDLSVALLVGILVGGLLTFSLYKIITLTLRRVKTNVVSSSPTPKTITQEPLNVNLSLETSHLSFSPIIEITGTASIDGILVISSSKRDYLQVVNNDAGIKENLNLDTGLNVFLASLINSKDLISKHLYIFYAPKATDSKTYAIKMGYVIDISDVSLQINTYETKNGEKSELFLLTTDSKTDYSKLKNDELVSINKNELAIGDFVVLWNNHIAVVPKPIDNLNPPQKTLVTKTMLNNKKTAIFPADAIINLDDEVWITNNKTLVAITP